MLMTALVAVFQIGARAQGHYVDLSTGIDGSGAPIPYGQVDDTWKVWVGGTTHALRVCKPDPFTAWASPPVAQWLTINVGNDFTPAAGPGLGTCFLRTTFTLPACPITDAKINFWELGGFDNIVAITINGIPYTFAPPAPNDHLVLTDEVLAVDAAHLLPGASNGIEIELRYPRTFVGFTMRGGLSVVYSNEGIPDPVITGPVSFCDAPSLTFYPSLVVGNDMIVTYGWESVECDALGVPVPGASPNYTYSPLVSGVPGPFTFPASYFDCAKNYRIKLSVLDICGVWNDAYAVIHACTPEPGFSASINTVPSGYYEVTATPWVMTPPPNPEYSWILQELDAAGNAVWTITNPSVWWSDMVNGFKGFDHTATAYSGTISSLPASPAVGRFSYGKTYRLTRGVWTAICPWEQFSLIFTPEKSAGIPTVAVLEDTHAPDLGYLKPAAVNGSTPEPVLDAAPRVYPNPGNGLFTVSLDHVAEGTIEVVDMQGKKIQSLQLNAGTNIYPIDLTGYAKGIYVINITTGGVRQSSKVILE